jgi:hypothetical protein
MFALPKWENKLKKRKFHLVLEFRNQFTQRKKIIKLSEKVRSCYLDIFLNPNPHMLADTHSTKQAPQLFPETYPYICTVLMVHSVKSNTFIWQVPSFWGLTIVWCIFCNRKYISSPDFTYSSEIALYRKNTPKYYFLSS